ncbi:hypothetical protein [Phenylobacterium montanum]|uniref:Uncharacterized protein n=1 Tax=Phenylobacterium montanum TaxID=2823693 RepID=A0A975IXA7_9CAUL|nr:hypothetical protein [Caulobacter sp. S6]QUD90434.1 hypothetical protein KCG34_11500 [Caulobacter sp. S6]
MPVALVADLHLPSWLGHPVELHRRPAPPGVPEDARQRFGPWTLNVKHDRFTGQVSCVLSAPRMSFDRAAVTFQFSPHTETYDAVYRVDTGPAFSWRLSAMALASHGVKLETDDPTNPSGGRVILPYSAVVGGKTVWIRPSDKKRAWPFRIDDLAPAVAAAKTAGCGAGFVGAVAE